MTNGNSNALNDEMTFTLLTSMVEPPPGKTYQLAADGRLSKTNNGIRRRLCAETKAGTLSDFTQIVRESSPNQHVVAGVCAHQTAIAFSARERSMRIEGDADACPVVGLGNEHFQFPQGGGLMVIDSDDVPDGVDVWGALVSAVAALEACARVEVSSSGANIYQTNTGKCLRGETGQHVFLHVAEGADISRALNVLHKRLWLNGGGHIKASAAGVLLERSLIDRQLAVPSQPIYLRSTMGEGLEQRKRIEYVDGIEEVDTVKIIPDLTPAEEERYAKLVAAAKQAALPEGLEIQRKYINDRVTDLTGKGVSRDVAEATVQRSLSTQELQGDWEVLLSDGQPVTVKEILADPAKYHDTPCRDPLEPDYGSRTVAKIYSDQGQPCIYSQAHGGQTFWLKADVSAMFAPLPEWNQTQQVKMEAGIEKELQTVLLRGWQDAPVVTGKDADVIGKTWLLHRLGVAGGALPANVEFPPNGVHGLTCRRPNEPPQRIRLGSQAMEEVITTWAKQNRDECLRGWPSVIAEHAAIDAPDDPVAMCILKGVQKVVQGSQKQVSDMFTEAWAAEQRRLMPPKVRTVIDPIEQEAVRQRMRLEREAALRAAAGDLINCTDLLGFAYRQAQQYLGVVGEKRIFQATLIAAVSAAFRRVSLIISLIVNGPSGSGKSFTSDCALRFLPDVRKFIATSLSDKALFHLDEDALAGRVFILFEANALSDPDNPLAMATRTLLTEGCIRYAVVEDAVRDDGTMGKKTIVKEIAGPTSLITTTTKLFLDPETETRALFIETDDSAEQTKAIMLAGVTAVTTGDLQDAQLPPDLAAQWHALLEWVVVQPSRVAIPYWQKVVEGTTTDVVRVRRDIGKLRSIITIHALLHRLHREVLENGAVVANADDYAFARQMVLPTLQRELGADVDDGILAVVDCVRSLIKKTPLSSSLHISIRQLQTETKLHRSTLHRRLHKAFKAGLLENHEHIKSKPMILTIPEHTVDLNLLPTVDEVCYELPDWLRAA